MRTFALILFLTHLCLAVKLEGVVIDKNTGDKIEATLELKTKTGAIISKTKSSELLGLAYQFQDIPNPFEGIIYITRDGYFSEEKIISIPETKKYRSFSKDFVLVPKKVNSEIKLASSPFYKNKSDFKPGFEILLNDILLILKKNPTLKFKIILNIKKEQQRNGIAASRINNLIDYFYTSGITKERFKYQDIPSENDTIKKPISTGSRTEKDKIIFKIISL